MLKKRLLEELNNNNHYTLPKYILSFSKKIDLDINSFILLIYLMNQKDKIIFDYKKIIGDLSFSEKELLDSISILKDKKILSIVMEKNDSGVLEEKMDISFLYEKVFSLILDDKKETMEENDLFSKFEEEFGRTLSPMEYEIIGGWIESNIDKDLILEALKEAVFNGANNLRYIDKILFEWNKKGIKKVSDIIKNNKSTEEKKQEEIYEYDWLNE